jgi:Predicted membrane protein (DUF2339)
MYFLLNRLAWVVSLIVGILVALYFMGYEHYEFAVWIWLGIGFIVKKVIFSSSGIEDAVTEWLHAIGKTSEFTTRSVDTISVSWWSYTGSMIRDPLISTDVVDTRETPEISTDTSSTKNPEYTMRSAPEFVSIPEEPSKIGLYLHSFFSDRPLAKVGGILLFLGALFFLWLIFDAVGPIGKTIIGLAFGFSLIGIWVWLDHKDITAESRVLFGVGIAVNYLTILSGRHLLGSDTGDGVLLSESMTTIALLLNTGLAIAISLVYRSRVLLGFAFIFAYLTPFLVDSSSSSIYLITIYTTILTLAIAIINSIYIRLAETKNIEYLQWIGIVGMTVLLSLASLDADGSSVLVICIWIIVSVSALALASYRANLSLVPVLGAGYVVLFASTFVASSYLIVPLSIVALLGMGIWLTFQSLISIVSIVVFGGIAFLLSLIGFIADWGQSIGILFITGFGIFTLLSILMLRSASLLLGFVALLGFGGLTFAGITFVDATLIDLSSLISTRAMAIFLLIWASIFTLRSRDAIYFLMAIILSGILMIYPDTFSVSISITTVALGIYLLISLVVPYILMRDDRVITHRSALLTALPVSALIITTAIYQIGHIEFPGLAMGVAYIIQAIGYLAYGMMISSRLLPTCWADIATLPATQKTDLLVLFALPLSLFTLALAFVFGDLPGMMSLAWILESSILYLVYTRIADIRIFFAACLVFLIGILRQTILVDSISRWDYITLAILTIMMAAVFTSLYLLRSDRKPSRMIYDILHILSVLSIGYGVSRIIPVTSYGWSLLGISTFILVLTSLYRSLGQVIHRQFLNVIFVSFCFLFLSRFDWLDKEYMLPLIIQFTTISIILGIGYIGYRSRDAFGYIDLATSLIASLIISSLYIDHFFGVFAVSIYLTIIAAITIIKGISTAHPLLRTVGLYIGAFALVKILGYDLWQDALGAINRVVALMIAGGVMMYLSQLYGKYVSRSWQEEFSLSNIFQTVWVEKETSEVATDNTPDINPFTGELALDLEKMDASDISAVEFVSPSGWSFTVKRSGVIKLALYITHTLGKMAFAPGELQSAHDYVLKYLTSNLPARELTTLLSKIEIWIREGGSVIFIKK